MHFFVSGGVLSFELRSCLAFPFDPHTISSASGTAHTRSRCRKRTIGTPSPRGACVAKATATPFSLLVLFRFPEPRSEFVPSFLRRLRCSARPELGCACTACRRHTRTAFPLVASQPFDPFCRRHEEEKTFRTVTQEPNEFDRLCRSEASAPISEWHATTQDTKEAATQDLPLCTSTN